MPESGLIPEVKIQLDTYSGMSLGGLLRHIDEEVAFSSNGDGVVVELDFEIEDLLVIRKLAADAALLEEVINNAGQSNNAA